MSELISAIAFSKHIGKSHQYVYKLIKQGKLIVHGKKRQLDLKEATMAIKANARASNVLGDKFNEEQKGKGAKKASLERTTGKAAKNSATKKTAKETKEESEMVGVSRLIAKAKLLEIANKAKTAELEYKIKVGKYLPIEIVEAENAKIAEILRSKLLNADSKITPDVMALKTFNEVKVYMKNFFNSLLQEFQELAKTAESNYKGK
jgi:hypothetical protein